MNHANCCSDYEPERIPVPMDAPSGLCTTRRGCRILRNSGEPNHDARCKQPRTVRTHATVNFYTTARDANTRDHLPIRLQRPRDLPAPHRTTRTIRIVKLFTDAAHFASETRLFKNGYQKTRWGVNGVLRQNLNASMGIFSSSCVPISAQSHCASNPKKTVDADIMFASHALRVGDHASVERCNRNATAMRRVNCPHTALFYDTPEFAVYFRFSAFYPPSRYPKCCFA